MNLKAIDGIVKAILASIQFSELPIDIENIARHRGLEVIPYPLENEISGILVIDPIKSTIGYNNSDSIVRRRFTIAHELGHYELHRNITHLFYDKDFKVMFRTSKTENQDAHQQLEREANAFAAALLMPEEAVKAKMSKVEFDLGNVNEKAIKDLAKLFNVSTTAMYYRMANLSLIDL